MGSMILWITENWHDVSKDMASEVEVNRVDLEAFIQGIQEQL